MTTTEKRQNNDARREMREETSSHRDRVDVRFDDRSRFNRHRERAEKNRREYRVEHAGGEISIIIILNHIYMSSSK